MLIRRYFSEANMDICLHFRLTQAIYISRFSENEAFPLKRYMFTDRYISNFDSKI